MQHHSTEQANNTELLNEIMMTSSDEIIENRFVSTDDSSSDAQCTGRCGSGVCRSFA